MFSKLVSHTIRRKEFFFLICVLTIWFVQLIFLAAFLLTVRGDFQQTITRDLQQTLETFLSDNRLLFLGTDVYSTSLDQYNLNGLAFVRIIRNDEHLLFSSSTGERLDFKELTRLDPGKSGCWIKLGENSEGANDKVWNVLSTSPAEGILIQTGRPDSHLYRLYRRLVRQVIIIAAGALGLAALLTFLGYRLSLYPLVQVGDKLTQIYTGGNDLLDVPSAGRREYRRIFELMNRIIRQNRQLVKEIEQSLDNVAHDLRTPMTRLRSVAEYGLQAGDDPEKLQNALADCLEESERVLKTLGIMMSVAEAESGTLKLDIQVMALSDSLHEVVQLYEYIAEEEGVTVSLDVPDHLNIKADRTRISQVWANLMDNAIKYSRRSGSVHVKGELSQDSVKVMFRDTGIGISAQEIGRIWDRLYRGDRSRSRQGLGLGLNYVKAVVEAHGGRIEVESVLNEGSVFTVSLPAADISETK